MSVVTLTTDWGTDGAYTGAFRGLLFSMAPSVQVVDISNAIKPFDVGQASFVLSQSFFYFPEGSVHIMGVNPVEQDTTMHRYVAIESNGHFFIGANSGVWELLFGESDFVLHEIEIQSKSFGGTGFPELEIFARSVVGIFKHKSLDFIGKSIPSSGLVRQVPMLPRLGGNDILGHVVFFDTYGNAITNISRTDIEEIGKGRPFEIIVRSSRHTIHSINTSYDESKAGQVMAIYSFSGFIEIAIVNGVARDMLSLEMNSEVLVKFKEAPAQGSLF